MKKLLLLALLYSCCLYSQEYEYGIVKKITSVDYRVSIEIDKVQVVYNKDGKMQIVNNNKSTYIYSINKTTNIEDCLYHTNPSNIINYNARLKEQFVLFIEKNQQLQKININCYN